MKIFSREYGQDVAYVQVRDLDYVERKADVLAIPTAVNIRLYSQKRGSYNKSKFVRFTDHEAVKFFQNLEAVVDYDQYKAKDEKEIEEECRTLLKKSTDMIEKRASLVSYVDIVHKRNELKELLEIRRGMTFVTIPEFLR